MTTPPRKKKVRPEMDAAVKELVKQAHKKTDYTLPKFDFDKLVAHIQALVDKAPGGVVQLVIDLFCGAGGTSEGIEQAKYFDKKCSVIIAGINHDIKAIYSQSVNHPIAYYTDEDIRYANLIPVAELVERLRKLFPQCPIIIWASLECTNHSNAKGGLPRDPDSRALPWELYRYIQALNPDGVWIENVKEFAEWGPMMAKTIMEKGTTTTVLKNPIAKDEEIEYFQKRIDEGFICSCPLVDITEGKGKKKRIVNKTAYWKPIKNLKGTFYQPWVETVNSYGYHKDQRILNAADYGTPQNRKRLFIIFMRNGWPICFPEPTHSKNQKQAGTLFDGQEGFLKPHVPVKVCLNFAVEGRSIFEPGHVKSIKTWERVYEGLIKFVAGGKENYMLQRNGGDPKSKVYSTESPARTVTATGGNQELVQPFWMIKYSSDYQKRVNPGLSIENPSVTITTMNHLGLLHACVLNQHWIIRYNNNHDGSVNKGSSVDETSPTVLTIPQLGLMAAQFLSKTHGHGLNSDVNFPSPTVATKDQIALLKVKYFMYKAYTGGGRTGSIDDPCSSITPRPKPELMQVDGFIMSSHYDNKGSALNSPAPTQTACRKHNYLVNMSWGGHVSHDSQPSVTIVARQDKAPIYLIQADESDYSLAIPIFEDDPEIVVKIKEFMVLYNIIDIKKRMLMIPELMKIQSFPETYFLAGTQTDQKKFIGNAVPPLVAKAIAESMYGRLVDFIINELKIAA